MSLSPDYAQNRQVSSYGNPAPLVVGANGLPDPTGLGTYLLLDVPYTSTVSSLTTLITGAPASCTIVLEGAMDGATWTTLATSTSTTGDTQFSNGVPFNVLRARVSAVSGGTAPKIAVNLACYTSEQPASGGAGQVISGTVTANQGTANSAANGWPVKVTDGTNTAGVTAPTGGSVTGNGQVVTTGNVVAGTSLSAVTSGNGTTVDFGSSKQMVNCVFTNAGTTSGGTLNLQVSVDGAFWVTVLTTPINASALVNPGILQTNTNTISVQNQAFRYARAIVVAAITGGGTVSAFISAS